MSGDAAGAAPALVFVMDPARTRNVFTDAEVQRLARATHLMRAEPYRSVSEIPEDVAARTEIAVTGWGCPALDDRDLSRLPKLRLLAHSAGTVKALLPAQAFARGIAVTSAAAANAIPVAEFTLAAILFANKAVFAFERIYRTARGPSEEQRALADGPIGNVGKTVGIVGASLIGRLVIEHLKRFDIRVLLADPTVSAKEAQALDATLTSLPDLLSEADVVSLHAPLLSETRHLIGGEALARMRDGATLINTARGAIVEQQALEVEAQSGRLNFIIDVSDPEPLPADSPLYDAPNVWLTPHVAGALGLERNRLGALVTDEVLRFVAGKPLRFRVDPARLPLVA